MTTIDTKKTGYQPLADVHGVTHNNPTPTKKERLDNAAAEEYVREQLEAAGFREYTANPASTGWYSRDQFARLDGRIVDGRLTLGVVISRHDCEWVNHQLDGAYGDLSIAEKFRLSGSPGTIEQWLEKFDRCGLLRPN